MNPVTMTRRNPLFPYVYRLGMPIFDRLFYNRYRRAAMSNATGRLLMVGLGPGSRLDVSSARGDVGRRRGAGGGVPADGVALLLSRHGIAVDIVDGIGRVDSVPGQQFRLGTRRAGVVLGRRCGRYPRRDPAGAGTRRQVGRPRARSRGWRDGPVPGPDRKAVVVVGFRLQAEPPNRRRHCRGRIRYPGTAQHPTNPGAAPVHTPSARIRHCSRQIELASNFGDLILNLSAGKGIPACEFAE